MFVGMVSNLGSVQKSVDRNKVIKAEFFLFVVMQIIRVILYLEIFFQICCCLGFSLGQ